MSHVYLYDQNGQYHGSFRDKGAAQAYCDRVSGTDAWISEPVITTFPKADLAGILTGALLNTRDFCGNEAECIADFCADERIDQRSEFGKAVIALAQEKARQEWNRCRRAARR